MDESQVVEAIGPLAEALRADGADVVVERVDATTIDLRLVLDDASCAECVMPAPTLVELFEGAARGAGLPVEKVRLADPREA